MNPIIKHLKENWVRHGFETLVVTVGILGAFTLNNWNENRKSTNREFKVLVELKAEFENNQVLLEQAIADHQTIENTARELSEIIGAESIITDVEKFDSIANLTIWPPQYVPADGVLNAVISSGDLALFENDELKYALSSLSGLIKRYDHWIDVDWENLVTTVPIITQRYSLRNFPFVAALGASNFKADPQKLSRSLEFESMVVLRWQNATSLKRYANDIYAEQDKIIQLIDSEIKRLR